MDNNNITSISEGTNIIFNIEKRFSTSLEKIKLLDSNKINLMTDDSLFVCDEDLIFFKFNYEVLSNPKNFIKFQNDYSDIFKRQLKDVLKYEHVLYKQSLNSETGFYNIILYITYNNIEYSLFSINPFLKLVDNIINYQAEKLKTKVLSIKNEIIEIENYEKVLKVSYNNPNYTAENVSNMIEKTFRKKKYQKKYQNELKDLALVMQKKLKEESQLKARIDEIKLDLEKINLLKKDILHELSKKEYKFYFNFDINNIEQYNNLNFDSDITNDRNDDIFQVKSNSELDIRNLEFPD